MRNVCPRRSCHQIKSRVVSRPAISNLVQEVVLAYQLEIIAHAPAYQIGMCLIEQHEFPPSILSISPDLASCIITPGEERIVPAVTHTKTFMDTERAAELLFRVRRHRRQIAR